MKFLRKLLDAQHEYVKPGAKFEKLFPIYEMIDTFLFTPGEVTKGKTHIRDAMDLKRLMVTVAIALLPCILFALYNTGLQANLALESMGLLRDQTWRGDLLEFFGVVKNSESCFSNMALGFLYFFPVFLVTNIFGGLWEVLFATIRKHEINEGFLVTGFLFPLILPPSIPLWQVALGISFGVVIGKEVFGGTGKNFLNPALTARAFLFFSYPGEISGDLVWTAVDGFSAATPLGQAAAQGISGITASWSQAFWGMIPGSMGETSTFACLLGAFFLILTGIGSWRIMLSLACSTALFAFILNSIGSTTNPMFALPFWWHFVIGGWAFGCVFMATDPVSASMTFKGQFFYGALIGFMIILIRVINPAFPEGTMLAILFGNVFAPLIDYFVMRANIKRRKRRAIV